MQYIDLPNVLTRTVTIRVDAVYAGQWQDLCISRIELWGDNVRPAAASAATAKDIHLMEVAIRNCDAIKGGPCEGLYKFHFGKVVNGWAVGSVSCSITDTASVILEKVGSNWVVVDLGTGMYGPDLRRAGVPEELARDFD
jgi:hypothetical protein